jgi:hypothetical protein
MTPDLIILVAFTEQHTQDEKSKRDARWQNNVGCDTLAVRPVNPHSLSRDINDVLETVKSWARHNLN